MRTFVRMGLKADLIASGDKRDLLLLGRFQGILIITARDITAREAVERKRQDFAPEDKGKKTSGAKSKT